jgi:hypothetical protein
MTAKVLARLNAIASACSRRASIAAPIQHSTAIATSVAMMAA